MTKSTEQSNPTPQNDSHAFFKGGIAANRGLFIGYCFAMAVVVAVANVAVFYRLNITIGSMNLGDYVTLASLIFPFTFVLNDSCNYLLGKNATQIVIFVGFGVGICITLFLASLGLSSVRIAFASGFTFLVSHTLNKTLFTRLYHLGFLTRPLITSQVANAVDATMFYGLAFAGTIPTWYNLALGDFLFKFLITATMLLPYRMMVNYLIKVHSTPLTGKPATDKVN